MARRRKGFEHTTDATRAYGWVGSTYISHENGNRGISRQAAERYARAYGVSVGWLLTGENPPDWLEGDTERPGPRPEREIPLLTMKELANLRPETLADHLKLCMQFSTVVAEPDLGDNTFKITLDDESMAPVFRTGEQVVVDLDQEPQPGEFAIAIVRGHAIFRRYRIGRYLKEGDPVIELSPINDGWPTVTLNGNSEDWIVGKVVKHTRNL